jgi:hypothetical protein
LIILAIADDDHSASELVSRLIVHQFVSGGNDNRIVKCSAPTRAQAIDRLVQRFKVVREIGHQFRCGVKAHDHGPVLSLPDYGPDKHLSRFLLETESIANAVASVDQDCETQR